MRRPLLHAAIAAALTGAALHAAAAVDPARQTAPADGFGAGTLGGSAAVESQVYTVSNRAQLLAAFALGGNRPKIVKVVGTIDMSEGVPFTGRSDQAARGQIRVPSYTTLIGAGPGAGFVNGHVDINGVEHVIVRNLKIVAPCDVAPVFDPTDGANGAWNAAYDAISITAAAWVWIDRNTITDVPVTDATLPIENGVLKQCHDGAIDITRAADRVTVSYNVIEQHDKTMLIGASDSATTDLGRLRVTIANNVFSGVKQRVPRVRFGHVHVFNNHFAGDKAAAAYAHSYSIGIGKSGQVISNANSFVVAGAAGCASVVTTVGADAVSAFTDSGSLLNGAALGACPVSNAVSWAVPYAFTPRPVALARANALAQAGAGKLSTAITGTGGIVAPAGTRLPAPGDSAAHVDAPLVIAFDSAPVLGTSGKITVRRTADNAVVDVIDIGTAPSATDTQTAIARTNLEIDALGLGAMPENPALARWVWYRPVVLSGNAAIIRLRDNKLRFGTGYAVSIDAGVLNGSIHGQPFSGLSGWSFTTRSAPASFTQVTVDDDGPADFRTLQGALNWVMANCSPASPAVNGCGTVATPKRITLKNGVYRGFNVLRRVNNLTIAGESRDGVVVGDVNFESLNSGSGATTATPGTALTTGGRVPGHRVLGGGRSALLVENADLLTLENFTLENPHVRSSAFDNQAEAIYFNTSATPAAARLVAKQMNFLAQQDTLQLKGYVWMWRSLVAGNVDFIWGGVMAALFEECEIRSVLDPSSSSPGFILQARATAGDKGFVFLNSTLTAGAGVTQAYLARSGGTASTTYVDNIAFVNTRIGPHILPVGWCVGTGTSRTGTGSGGCGTNPPPWSGVGNGGSTDAVGWREFGSLDLAGAPLDVSARLGLSTVTVGGLPASVSLAAPLASAAGLSTRAEVFFNATAATGAPGGWVPAP